MKRSIIFISAAVIFSMAFLPAAVNTVFVSAMPDGGKSKAAELITESNDEAYDAGLIENSTGIPEETGADTTENRENSGTEKTYNVSGFEDYITGVVAAEMPASFEAEALKAQAVAARTYAKRRIDAGNTLDDMIKNGGQAYNSVEDMKNKEQSDANTSCHVWPQRYCLLLNGLQKIVSKLRNKYRRFRILYK